MVVTAARASMQNKADRLFLHYAPIRNILLASNIKKEIDSVDFCVHNSPPCEGTVRCTDSTIPIYILNQTANRFVCHLRLHLLSFCFKRSNYRCNSIELCASVISQCTSIIVMLIKIIKSSLTICKNI